ncbi:unnamed protein product, partial [Ilex paraguariensis]
MESIESFSVRVANGEKLICDGLYKDVPIWLQGIKEVLGKLASDLESVKDFELADGLLKYHSRVVVPFDDPLRRDIMQHFHDSMVGGYYGVYRTV